MAEAKDSFYISILGDSISTLEGYQPGYYEVYYEDFTCELNEVFVMEDTWWGRVIEALHGKLLVNDSWSGSRVTKYPDSKEEFPAGCSLERTGRLHAGGQKPNMILVYMGTNDWGYGVDPEEFREAYRLMLKRLRINYPDAEIWCFSLNKTKMLRLPSFVFPEEVHGHSLKEFNAIIRSCAEENGCFFADLYSLQTVYETYDGTHPNVDGMKTLASRALWAMGKMPGL